jgi:hypothetical protein
MSSRFDRSLGESEMKMIRNLVDNKDERLILPFEQAIKPVPNLNHKETEVFDSMNEQEVDYNDNGNIIIKEQQKELP